MYVRTYIHTYTHTYTLTYTQTYIQAYIQTYTDTETHTHIDTHRDIHRDTDTHKTTLHIAKDVSFHGIMVLSSLILWIIKMQCRIVTKDKNFNLTSIIKYLDL